MKNIFFCAFVLAGISSPAFASLSGFFDSGEQLQVITNSSQVGDALHQLPIDRIERVGKYSKENIEWKVVGDSCSLNVFLKAVPPQAPNGAPLVGKTTYAIVSISPCSQP